MRSFAHDPTAVNGSFIYCLLFGVRKENFESEKKYQRGRVLSVTGRNVSAKGGKRGGLQPFMSSPWRGKDESNEKERGPLFGGGNRAGERESGRGGKIRARTLPVTQKGRKLGRNDIPSRKKKTKCDFVCSGGNHRPEALTLFPKRPVREGPREEE